METRNKRKIRETDEELTLIVEDTKMWRAPAAGAATMEWAAPSKDKPYSSGTPGLICWPTVAGVAEADRRKMVNFFKEVPFLWDISVVGCVTFNDGEVLQLSSDITEGFAFKTMFVFRISSARASEMSQTLQEAYGLKRYEELPGKAFRILPADFRAAYPPPSPQARTPI